MLPRSRAVAGLVMALTLTSSVPTRADEGGLPPSLDEATYIKRVLDRSPQRAAFAERRRAASARAGAAAGPLPNPILSVEREAVSSIGVRNDYVRLGWSLDLSGRRGLTFAAAAAGADAERLDVDRDAYRFEVEARLAYLEAVYAREHLASLDGARTQLGQLVDVLTSRAKQGDASSYDADRAALELETLDDEIRSAQRALDLARLALGGFVGEPGQAYHPADALALPAKPAGMNNPARPDVEAALARARQADREVRVAQRRWVPRFDLMAGLTAQASPTGDGIGSDGIGYVVGVGGELPVFDRGTAAAARARAEAKRWRAEADALASDVRGEAAQAARDVLLRIDQAEVFIAGPAARATDLQQRAAIAYREGDRPILELLDVQRTARQTAVRSVELVYGARRAALVLARVIGRQP